MPGRDLDLVTRGYTISVRTAAFRRPPRPPAAAEKEPVTSMATGEIVSAGEGDGLPAAPPERGWQLVAANQHLDFSRRHVMETEQRIVRQATLIQNLERSGCGEMASIGRTLLHALQASLRAAHVNIERRQELLHQSNGKCAEPRHSAGAELAQIDP